MKPRPFSITTASLIALTFVLLVSGASSGALKLLYPPANAINEAIFRTSCAILGLLMGGWVFLRLCDSLGSYSKKSESPIEEPTFDNLEEFQRLVAEHLEESFGKEAVVTFTDIINSPSRHRLRVIESITLEERVATQQVSIEFCMPTVPDEKGGPRYIPLFCPPKGHLIDTLKITDVGGKPLPYLSFKESSHLVAAGLRFLLIEALKPPRRGGIKKFIADSLSPEAKILEFLLLRPLARRSQAKLADLRYEIDIALAAYRFLLVDDEDLRRYVEVMSAAYPIVAVVPRESITGNRIVLRYEQSLIPAALSKHKLGALRTILGVRPNRIVAPMGTAGTAASFHMYLLGPPGMYVLQQDFRCKYCEESVSRKWEVRKPDDKSPCWHEKEATSNGNEFNFDHQYRVAAKRGQSFAHVYTHGFGDPTKSHFNDLELFVELKEVPPGSRASAVVTAVVATFLIGIMGRLASNGQPSVGSLPGLVLALPAAVATWFGFSADSKSLVGSSMLARISQIATAIISALAIAVYVTSHHGHIWHGVSILGISEPVWALLFLMSAFNLAYIGFRFVLKFRTYNNLLQRGDDVEAGVDVKCRCKSEGS